MKKVFIIFVMIFSLLEIYAYDLNLDLEAEFLYNNYIKNETYNYMASQVTLTAFDSIQKSRIKLKERIDQIKFDFDARLYLKPNQNKFEYFVDSAYFFFENGPFILYAGKQRIRWGTGYTWNPTDKLQPKKNIIEPNTDLEGFYALRMDYSNDFISPSLVIAPAPQSVDKDFRENFKFGVQLYKLIGTVDFLINSIYQMNIIQVLGSAISYDADFLILNLEGAAVRYMRISDDYQGIYGYEPDTLNWTYLIGITKNIESKFFICAEYYYDGWGMTNKQFVDYIAINKFSLFGVKKRYFSLNMSWTWDEKITFAITGIYGVDDKSTLLYPKVEYVENSNFNVEIGFIENITDAEKESYYSMPVHNITILKLKVYF